MAGAYKQLIGAASRYSSSKGSHRRLGLVHNQDTGASVVSPVSTMVTVMSNFWMSRVLNRVFSCNAHNTHDTSVIL